MSNQSNCHCNCNAKHFYCNYQCYKEIRENILPRLAISPSIHSNCNCQQQHQQLQQLQQHQAYDNATQSYEEFKNTYINGDSFNPYNAELYNSDNNPQMNSLANSYSPKVKCLLQSEFSNSSSGGNGNGNGREFYQGETFVMNERNFFI